MISSILFVVAQIGVALILPTIIVYTALPAKRPQR